MRLRKELKTKGDRDSFKQNKFFLSQFLFEKAPGGGGGSYSSEFLVEV